MDPYLNRALWIARLAIERETNLQSVGGDTRHLYLNQVGGWLARIQSVLESDGFVGLLPKEADASPPQIALLTAEEVRWRLQGREDG